MSGAGGSSVGNIQHISGTFCHLLGRRGRPGQVAGMGGQWTGDGDDRQMTALAGGADGGGVGNILHIPGRGGHDAWWETPGGNSDSDGGR